MPKAAIDDDIEKLYQLPLEEFTAARNSLAKQAGAAGTEIRSLQKPPVAAWAVNQVYWKDRPVYDALIEAASTMRAAHSSVLAGKRTDLRGVGKEHEEALEAALKAALAQLEESGHPATDATRQAIATTLRGLPTEEPPGRLGRTLQPGGFEMLAGIPMKSAPAAKAAAPRTQTSAGREEPASKPNAADAKALARARETLASAARTLRLAEHTARREEFEAARAARDVEKAEREAETAREHLEEAQKALTDAERNVTAVEKKRDAAQRRSKDADAALSTAQDRVRAAEREVEQLSKSKSR